MKAIAKTIVTGVAAATVFGMSGLTSTAFAAEPAVENLVAVSPEERVERTGDEMSAQSIHTHNGLTNNSQYRMVLTGYHDAHGEDRLPAIGTAVQPGQSIGFDVTVFVFVSHTVHAYFDMFDVTGAKVGTYELEMWTSPFQSGATTRWGPVPLSPTSEVVGMDFQHTVWDPSGTVIQVPEADKQRQAKVLEEFCTSGAACSFTPKKVEEVMSNEHPIGIAVPNDGPLEAKTSITRTVTSETSSNVSVKASLEANIFDVVKIAFEASYGKTWMQSDTFTQTVEVPIKPFHKAQVIGREPMIRTTGDFKVTMNNVTWELKDVYFESPDPKPTPERAPEWYIKQTPLTRQEQQVLQSGGELSDAVVLGDEGTAS